jgi:hypothetical protein
MGINTKNKKVLDKNWAKLEFIFFCTTYLLIFSQITFFGCTSSSYIHEFEIRIKFCIFLILVYAKKRIKTFFWVIEYSTFVSILRTSRMQSRKKWLNQLENLFNKHFKNIIWPLFAGEPNQVVKITVTCRAFLIMRPF